MNFLIHQQVDVFTGLALRNGLLISFYKVALCSCSPARWLVTLRVVVFILLVWISSVRSKNSSYTSFRKLCQIKQLNNVEDIYCLKFTINEYELQNIENESNTYFLNTIICITNTTYLSNKWMLITIIDYIMYET